MDGLVGVQVLVELVRDLDRAVLGADRAARAFLLNDVPGLLGQSDPEIADLSLYTLYFGIGEDLYVGVPADLDQLGRENSHRAVIGGVGLVQLSHVPPNGR